MAEIVFIHGIGQQRWDSGDDLLCESWLPALAQGLRGAQRNGVAGSVAPENTTMVFYAHLFRERGAMGAASDLDDLEPEAVEFAEALAREWIERAAHRADDPGLQRDAAGALVDLDKPVPPGQAMGPMGLVRRASAAAAKLRFFARPSFAVAQAVVNRDLREVTHYMIDTVGLRDEIRNLAVEAIQPDTRIIVAHSLGSIVAYEAVHRIDTDVELLVTVGSPLGLDTIIYDRLDPKASYPPAVKWWVNAADTDDIVAADPALAGRFGHEWQGRVRDIKVDNGRRYHAATAYLEQPVVATAIADVLRGSR